MHSVNAPLTKREYYRIAASLPDDFLRDLIAQPSVGMRPIHVLLARLVLRDRTRGRA